MQAIARCLPNLLIFDVSLKVCHDQTRIVVDEALSNNDRELG